MVSRTQVLVISLNGMELPAGNLTRLPASQGLQLESSGPCVPALHKAPRPQEVRTFNQDRLLPAPQTLSSQSRMGGSGRTQPRVGQGERGLEVGDEAATPGREASSAGRAAGAAPSRTWPGSRRAPSRNSPLAKEAWASPAGRPSPSVPGCPGAAPHCNPRDPRFPPLRTPLWQIRGFPTRPNRWLRAGCGGAAPARTALETLGCARPAPRPPCPAQPRAARLCPPGRGLCRPRGCGLGNTCSSGSGWGSTRAPLSGPSPGLREVLPPPGSGYCLSALERETIYPAGDWVWGGGNHPPPTFPAAPRPRCRARSGRQPQPRGQRGTRGRRGARGWRGPGSRGLSPALSLHSFGTRQIRYYSTGSTPLLVFQWVGEGEGNRRGALLCSGKGELPNLEREKEERMEGAQRQTDRHGVKGSGLKAWRTRLSPATLARWAAPDPS